MHPSSDRRQITQDILFAFLPWILFTLAMLYIICFVWLDIPWLLSPDHPANISAAATGAYRATATSATGEFFAQLTAIVAERTPTPP